MAAPAGVGLPALGHHGEGRGVPAGEILAGAGRHRRLVLDHRRGGADHAGAGRLRRHLPAGHEGRAGLFHHQPPGPDHAAAGPEQRPGAGGRHLPHGQPRDLQGLALHGRRHRRPRDRHARPGPALRPVQRPCRSRPRWPWWRPRPWQGVPLLNGFISKEMFFAETTFVSGDWTTRVGLPLAATVAGAFSVAYSLRFILQVFFGPPATDLPRAPHEPPRWMLFPARCWCSCACWSACSRRTPWVRSGHGRAEHPGRGHARIQPGRLARREPAAGHERGRHDGGRGAVPGAARAPAGQSRPRALHLPLRRPAQLRRRCWTAPAWRRPGCCAGWRPRACRCRCC